MCVVCQMRCCVLNVIVCCAKVCTAKANELAARAKSPVQALLFELCGDILAKFQIVILDDMSVKQRVIGEHVVTGAVIL